MDRWLKARKGLVFLLGLAVVCWWVRYHPPGRDVVVFDDDARQHVYWTAKFKDPDLFHGDLLTEFISSKLFDPVGYQAVYRMGVEFLDPLQFSQILGLFLLLCSIWLLFELSSLIITSMGGRILCVLLFLLFSLYDSSGGLPRSFAFPLLLLFLYLLSNGAFRGAVISTWLQALFYPPIILNCAAISVWEHARRGIRGKFDRRWVRDAAFAFVVLAAAGAFLWTVYRGPDSSAFGGKVTISQAREMPEFYPGGRSVFFRPHLVEYLLLDRSGIGILRLVGFLVIFSAVSIPPGPRGIRFPGLCWTLILTSLFLFAVAHLTLFRLHLPSRYTHYTLTLAFMLAIGANTERLIQWATPGWFKGLWARHLGWGRAMAWAMLLLAVVFYGWLQGKYICKVDPLEVVLDRKDMELMDFLRSLPKGSLIAGHPLDMDNVPLMTQRKVLANQELSIPYYLGYYLQVRQRIMDMLSAYYSRDLGEFMRFNRRYGVDAFVIRKDRLCPQALAGPLYYEPFNGLLRARWGGNPDPKGLVLKDPPQRLRCFENSRYVVLCFNVREQAASRRDGGEG